jgi:hypothetical protein
MNKNVDHYYQESSGDDSASGHFHKVIALHDEPSLTWELVLDMAPSIPRGWFELSKLAPACRVEFIRDYWMSKLPYNLKFSNFLNTFFEDLEDVKIYLTQQVFAEPFHPELVYSQKGNGGFFHAGVPCSETYLIELCKSFPSFTFPIDYLAFLRIHDGFSKYTDTGLMKTSSLLETYQSFQAFLALQDPLMNSANELINPKNLVPFYESFGLHCYQCFYSDWYPEQEMGNIYYSGIEHSLSDMQHRSLWTENLAFPTFLDWLLFYLKGVDEL